MQTGLTTSQLKTVVDIIIDTHVQRRMDAGRTTTYDGLRSGGLTFDNLFRKVSSRICLAICYSSLAILLFVWSATCTTPTDADCKFDLQMTNAKLASGVGFQLESEPGASRSETRWRPRMGPSPAIPVSRSNTKLQQEAVADVVGVSHMHVEHWHVQLLQAHHQEMHHPHYVGDISCIVWSPLHTRLSHVALRLL